MKKSMRVVITAALLVAAPVAGTFAAGTFTIPSVPIAGGGPMSSLSGPGTLGANGDGVFGSPGVGTGTMSFGGLSSTLGLTGAANGGIGGTSGGFTGTTGGIAGAQGGLAGG